MRSTPGQARRSWSFKTGEDPDIHNQVGIQSSAVIANGIVYFGCRDSNLYALDAKTGEKKWVFNNKGSWVIGTPIVKDGKLYFTTSDSGMFYGVDAKTGNQIFSLKFIWPMFSSPAIAGNTLVYRFARRKVAGHRSDVAEAGLDVLKPTASSQNGASTPSLTARRTTMSPSPTSSTTT